MNFDEFKAEFISENRKLKMIIAIGLVIFSIGTLSSLLDKRYYLYKGKEIFEERPLAEEVCKIAFMSLVEENPNSFVISDQIIRLVKKEPFSLIVTKILKLSSSELDTCKIIIKSESKLLAFKIILEGKESNPFFYKLTEIQEILPGDEG